MCCRGVQLRDLRCCIAAGVELRPNTWTYGPWISMSLSVRDINRRKIMWGQLHSNSMNIATQACGMQWRDLIFIGIRLEASTGTPRRVTDGAFILLHICGNIMETEQVIPDKYFGSGKYPPGSLPHLMREMRDHMVNDPALQQHDEYSG